MKVLVIHPQDKSTDFLKIIYEDKDYDVINDCNINKQELKEIIKKYDKIIMMGHGTPYGLINPKRGGYIIDSSFVDILKTKETISIWCNSQYFFERYNMKGFHTGMIISEVAEAQFVLEETPLNKEETLANMIAFSDIVRDCIEKTPNEMKYYILEHYNFKDKVTQYNRENIIVL